MLHGELPAEPKWLPPADSVVHGVFPKAHVAIGSGTCVASDGGQYSALARKTSVSQKETRSGAGLITCSSVRGLSRLTGSSAREASSIPECKPV